METSADKLRALLDAYRKAKLALQNERRTELERLHGTEPAARQEASASTAPTGGVSRTSPLMVRPGSASLPSTRACTARSLPLL